MFIIRSALRVNPCGPKMSSAGVGSCHAGPTTASRMLAFPPELAIMTFIAPYLNYQGCRSSGPSCCLRLSQLLKKKKKTPCCWGNKPFTKPGSRLCIKISSMALKNGWQIWIDCVKKLKEGFLKLLAFSFPDSYSARFWKAPQIHHWFFSILPNPRQ